MAREAGLLVARGIVSLWGQTGRWLIASSRSLACLVRVREDQATMEAIRGADGGRGMSRDSWFGRKEGFP